MRIVETDNFGGDYPDESFVNLPRIGDYDKAIRLCREINIACSGTDSPRWWKVENDDYKLQPGFEP